MLGSYVCNRSCSTKHLFKTQQESMNEKGNTLLMNRNSKILVQIKMGRNYIRTTERKIKGTANFVQLCIVFLSCLVILTHVMETVTIQSKEVGCHYRRLQNFNEKMENRDKIFQIFSCASRDQANLRCHQTVTSSEGLNP